MTRITCFFLFLLVYTEGDAQNPTLDKHATLIANLSDDTAKVRQLYNLAQAYKEAIKYAQT